MPRCSSINCLTDSSFGYPGGKRVACKTHRAIGQVDLTIKEKSTPSAYLLRRIKQKTLKQVIGSLRPCDYKSDIRCNDQNIMLINDGHIDGSNPYSLIRKNRGGNYIIIITHNNHERESNILYLESRNRPEQYIFQRFDLDFFDLDYFFNFQSPFTPSHPTYPLSGGVPVQEEYYLVTQSQVPSLKRKKLVVSHTSSFGLVSIFLLNCIHCLS